MKPLSRLIPLLLLAWILIAPTNRQTEPEVRGAMRKWHPITITFEGPFADESDRANPFRNYRLNVLFVREGTTDTLFVPGFFAADGNAAETGATGGRKWRVRFTAHETGTWAYTASFRTGEDVAMSLDPKAGNATAFDGQTGSFTIQDTDKTGRDFRGKGMLRYVGEHHLRFDNGEWFLKGGADSPETLLAFRDFDGTYDHGGGNSIKSYAPHLEDWREGDPAWQEEKGKGLIGALNYLAGKGMNAFSFLTMNVTGDGKNVWPWISHVERDRYDVSKLEQWEKVFSHADSLGLYLHFKTRETEVDQLLDEGYLGPFHRLYYRELIARFGHHLALNWNLGEENDLWDELNDPEQKVIKETAQYIRDLDPYDHHIVIHTYPDQQDEVYGPLLGPESALTGVSLQTNFDRVHEDTRRWVEASARSGKKWVVANDEQGNADTGVKPDGEDNNHDDIRALTLWGNLMAGGAGVEYYFGYRYQQSDLNLEDFRSRDRMWDYTRHALDFFYTYLPFWEMTAADALTSSEDDYVLAKPGEIYVIYQRTGREPQLRLDAEGSFTVHWYNPRTGGALQEGSLNRVTGGNTVALGTAPSDPDQDWVALVRIQR